MNRPFCLLLFLPLLMNVALRSDMADSATFEIRSGDRIAIIGNALADRMQHAGYLEALVHSRFPNEELVFRNLAFAGDELTVRLRSEGFGSPHDWLERTGADVVWAFFGYNESFQDRAGLDRFREELEEFVSDTLKRNYGGKGQTRLVLFAPTAAERHPDPNFPDPAPLNERLELYLGVMAEVAAEHGVRFVDLFALSQEVSTRSRQPLTINGVHLSDAGYRALAPGMFEALLGQPAPEMDNRAFDSLLEAVNEKNAAWFARYRTVDGYNVYGGRSYLKFGEVMNRDTMQREMEMRDVMTANRDARVWARAKGRDMPVTDDNLPAPIQVDSNRRGPNPDGSHRFLSGQDAIEHMTVPPGCEVTLFACEKRFPLLANPVQMAFDTRGRLWVAAWPNYPGRTPLSRQGDSLLVFEDTNGDGVADRCMPFLEDLNCPTGFQFYKDGVLVVQAPDVWFVRDTNGDGRGDWKVRILNGLDSADSHHTANALALDPGGAIYLSDGVFHRTQVETPWGPPVRNIDAAIYRYEPQTARFETHIAYGFANPHGRVFDGWGNDLVTDATGNNTYFGPAFSGRLPYPQKHGSLREFWPRPSRPCAGTGLLSSRHFPESFQDNFLNCNVIGFLGIFRVHVKEEGSGLWGETIDPPLVSSSDPNFRPVAVDVAPDGSIYFLDWHNPIIGHMQHHLRDPSRDHRHGRIYRITYPERPLLEPAPIAGQPIEALLELLTTPEHNVRTRAKIELGARDTKQVIAATRRWAAQFDPQATDDQHALAEALWVHQWHDQVYEPLLRQLLGSPEPRARAAAVRVLGYWRDRVVDPLALLRVAANDDVPRVRLEAVRVASFFDGREALEVACEILQYDTDYYLDYTFNETMRVLQPPPQDLFVPDHPRARQRMLSRLSNADLLLAPELEPVWVERLERPGIEAADRVAALDALASHRQSNRIEQAFQILKALDQRAEPAAAPDLGLILAAHPASELVGIQSDLRHLAQTGAQETVRRAAWAGLVTAEGGPESAWADTAEHPEARATLIDSVILHLDPSFRARFQPLLMDLLDHGGSSDRVRHAAFNALPLMGPEHASVTFQRLIAQLRPNQDLATVARAIMQLPRESWDPSLAQVASRTVRQWAATVPVERRTGRDFIEAVQFGMELADHLPAEEAAQLRRELLGFGVRVFAIKAVREQMRYDTTRIVVEAGQPFEIIFENIDMMPHNLVIVQPGAREEIGLLAEAMSPRPDRQGRAYVPRSVKVLAATRMLEPGEQETLQLTAPVEPGEYEYVCTYPEHWSVMYGQLLVVHELEAFLESAPAPVNTPAISTSHTHAGH
jgi:glucose/arabinose dehydrogenase/azurin/HEAT repeat protein